MKKLIAIILSIIIILAVTFPAAALSTVKLTGIDMGVTTVRIMVGQTTNLNVKLIPANTTQKRLTYVTGNKKVATISSTGKIIGVGQGTTTITVYSVTNNKIFGKCRVSVYKPSKTVTTLKMWGGVPPEAGPQMVCDNFNKEFAQAGYKLEYERFVNDEQGNMKLDTNLLAGSGIDIYVTYTPDYLSKRALGNMALDLSGLTKRDDYDLEKNFSSMAKSYYVNGKPYSVPAKIDQYGFLANMEMFAAAGVAIPTTPWTLEQFRDAAKKLTKGEGLDKVYGVFFNSQQEKYYPIDYFAAQVLGGDYYFKNGGKECDLDNPVIVKTVKTVAEMMNVDKSAPTHVDSVVQKLTQEGMFLTGKSAMTLGSWIIRNVKDTKTYPHDFVTAFIPYPTPEKKSGLYTQGGYGDHLCINPKSKNIDMAWEFIKWYCEKGELPMAKFGRVPSHVAFDRSSITKAFLEGAENLFDAKSFTQVLVSPKAKYAVPNIMTKRAELKKVLDEELEAIYAGKKTAEEGMSDAKKRGDTILAQK